jgi:hypothetical protein
MHGTALLTLLPSALAIALPRAIPSAIYDSLSAVPASSLAFTLYTTSTPACSRDQASWQIFTANTSTLGSCQTLSASSSSVPDYNHLSLDLLPSPQNFPSSGVVLRFYSDDHCQFKEDEFSIADLLVNKCEKVVVGGSWKVLRPAATETGKSATTDDERIEKEGISGEFAFSQFVP